MHEDMIYSKNFDRENNNINSAPNLNSNTYNFKKLIDVRKTIDTDYNKNTNNNHNTINNNNINNKDKDTNTTTDTKKMKNQTQFHTSKNIVISCSFALITSTMLLTTIFLLTTILRPDRHITQADAKPLSSYQIRFRRLPPKEFTASLGSSITIECEAGGSPQPMIHWLKDGKRIVQNEASDNEHFEDEHSAYSPSDESRTGLSTTRSRLFIDCANVQDEATYTCVAENAFTRISSNTKLNMIGINPLDVSENELNDLVAGLGKQDDAGQTQYKTNDIKRDNNKPIDSLTAVSQCLRQTNKQQSPVRIHMWTHNVLENMKNDIILYCRSNAKKLSPILTNNKKNDNNQPQLQSQQQYVYSAPTNTNNNNNNNDNNYSDLTNNNLPNDDLEMDLSAASSNGVSTVSWMSPDEKLITSEQSERYVILDTGDLLIKNLRWADMGNYVCTVSDGQTSDSISTFVYPAALPSNNQKKESRTSTSKQQSTSTSSDGPNNNNNSKIKRAVAAEVAANAIAQDDTIISHIRQF